MTHSREFWKKAFETDLTEEITFGKDQSFVNYPREFATVNFVIIWSCELDEIMDKMRFEEHGYLPLWGYDGYDGEIDEGYYKYYISINDIDGGKLDNAIMCVVRSTAEDDGEAYYIDIDEEDQKTILSLIDEELKTCSATSIAELLKESREELSNGGLLQIYYDEMGVCTL